MYVLKLEFNYYLLDIDKLDTSMPMGVGFFSIEHWKQVENTARLILIFFACIGSYNAFILIYTGSNFFWDILWNSLVHEPKAKEVYV